MRPDGPRGGPPVAGTPEPAVDADAIRAFLDAEGLGNGEVSAKRIGAGHSNLVYLVRRGSDRFVLRRPPLGDLAPSANDVLREARLLVALAGTAVPVPAVLATCSDEAWIGAPFFVMNMVDGAALTDRLPPSFNIPGAPEAITSSMVATLAGIHAIDLEATGLAALAKPVGYLDRQLRRFAALLDRNATRPLPDLHRIGEWLARNQPRSVEATLVHGDYRLGNLLFAEPTRVAAVLDWEMATIGDPLADLGYCTAVWAESGNEENPMLALGRITRNSAFPGRQEIASAYSEQTGRPIDALPWYQVLALWKAAIFLEGSYARYLAGDSADPFFAGLEEGVPALARAALRPMRD